MLAPTQVPAFPHRVGPRGRWDLGELVRFASPETESPRNRRINLGVPNKRAGAVPSAQPLDSQARGSQTVGAAVNRPPASASTGTGHCHEQQIHDQGRQARERHLGHVLGKCTHCIGHDFRYDILGTTRTYRATTAEGKSLWLRKRNPQGRRRKAVPAATVAALAGETAAQQGRSGSQEEVSALRPSC